MGAVNTKYPKSALVPLVSSRKDVFIFDSLYTIAVYEPTLAAELTSWGSNTIFVDYEWIGNWELDKYLSLAKTKAYELHGGDGSDPTKIMDVDKWRFIGQAWKYHLVSSNISKPPTSMFDPFYLDLVDNTFRRDYQVDAGAHVEVDGRIRFYRYQRHLNRTDLPIDPKLMLWRTNSKQNRITAAHPLSYFPTNLTTFLSSYTFYDPSDPNMESIMISRYGNGWDKNPFFPLFRKLTKKILLSDVIKTFGYDLKIDFSFLAQGNKTLESQIQMTLNHSLEFGGIINRGYNYGSILEKSYPDKKNVTTYNGKPVDRYDVSEYDLAPLEDMVGFLKNRDTYIMSWIRGGPIYTLPMVATKNLISYSSSGTYKGKQRWIKKDPYSDITHPVRLVRESQGMSLGSILQGLISAIPIAGQVVDTVQEIYAKVQSSPEAKAFLDCGITASIIITTGSVAGAAGLTPEKKNDPTFWQDVGKKSLDMIAKSTIGGILEGKYKAITGLTPEELGTLAKFVYENLDDKIKVVLCGIVMTIDNRFGVDAPGGSKYRVEYLLPPEAFADGGIGAIGWLVGGSLAGLVLLKVLKKKKETK